MNRRFTGLLLLCVPFFALAGSPAVKTGIEVLRENHFDILQGKRVGLITNPSGVDANLTSTVDILLKARNVSLVALYGPEHGVRGDAYAGDKVENGIDSATGLPMFSLYGKTRKPTPDMLKGIDVLVYDLQDVGCRSYTFISTMGLAMEAAAENNIGFVVLDRPNPLGGQKVEGNIVEKGFVSFVSQYPIPYVYGLTCGELARMLNDEGMLAKGRKCNLTVVPMRGWKRSMTFEETGLPWVPTSPHIPEASSAKFYAATGIAGELQTLSVGIGYTLPFHTFAAEWIKPEQFAARLNALQIEGARFRPTTFRPFYGAHKDRILGGVQMYFTNYQRVDLLGVQFLCLQVLHEMYPDRDPFTLADSSRLAMFDKVVGSDKVREIFGKRMKYADLAPFLSKDVASFKGQSKKYLLY